MADVKKLNRAVMLTAISGALALGSLSISVFGIGTSPSNADRVVGASASDQIALKLDGVNGESQDSNHQNEIEILSWS